jgi:signal transduction histidine kinase
VKSNPQVKKAEMVIKKKEIKPLCEMLSSFAGPLSFYDPRGQLLYESPALKKQELLREEVSAGGMPVGYVGGTTDKLKAVAALMGLYLNNLEEKKSLTTHTLLKYKELNFVSELSEILSSSIDIDEVLQAVTLEIHRMLGAENCSVMVIDAKTNKFFLKAASGKIVNENSWLDLMQGVISKALETGKTVMVNEPPKHPDFAKGGCIPINCMMCVPLKSKDKIVGVLNLSNKNNGIFTSEDESLLASVSVMIAGAIENTRLLEEKIKNEKFATIGQMAAGIIHDIKNPMTTIKGFAGLMGDMDFTPEERKEYSNLIVSEVDRLVGMVEDLLTFSRGLKSKLTLEKITVEGFFAEVIPFLEKDMTARKIKVMKQLDYKDIFYVDAERFKRVVFNLAGNAREAMHGGGNFLILTRPQEQEVELVFADSGQGIPENIIHDVFEPFVTMGKKSGTGLGLAITKKIVEEHGGSISALNGNYSGVEGFHGANLVIRLPRRNG